MSFVNPTPDSELDEETARLRKAGGPRAADAPVTSNERVIRKAAADLRAAMTFAWRDYDSLKSALDQASRKVRQVIATLERSAVETSDDERMRNTLLQAGYVDCGGELWKPPLGPRPVFLDENTRLRAGLQRIGEQSLSFKPVVDRLLAGESIEDIASSPLEPSGQDTGIEPCKCDTPEAKRACDRDCDGHVSVIPEPENCPAIDGPCRYVNGICIHCRSPEKASDEQLYRLRPLCICDNALTNQNPACPVHGEQKAPKP